MFPSPSCHQGGWLRALLSWALLPSSLNSCSAAFSGKCFATTRCEACAVHLSRRKGIHLTSGARYICGFAFAFLVCTHHPPDRWLVSLPSCHLSPVNNVALMVHRVLRSYGLRLWFLIRAGSIPSSLKKHCRLRWKKRKGKILVFLEITENLCSMRVAERSGNFLCVLGLLYYQ